MADIYLGVALILAISLGIFVVTLGISRISPRIVCNVLALLTVVGMLVYIRYCWYNVWLTTLLPLSNLIVLGNWFPLATAFLAGLAWKTVPGGPIRKMVPVVALFIAGAYSILSPVLGEPPQCGNRWSREGICIQTTQITCTPACAATMLRLHGIEATEREMARLCLTRKGTSWMGLYHGLKRKTAGTKWDVEVVSCRADELRELCTSPMILTVGLHDVTRHDAAYRTEEGWIPGVDHSVVLLEFRSPNWIEVADPSPEIGLECWRMDDLNVLWRGPAVRLVPRQSP
jgi:hypothetical protein